MKLFSFTPIIASVVFLLFANKEHTPLNKISHTPNMDTIKSNSSIKTEEVIYMSNGKKSIGFIAYDENRKGKLPIVIIVHEWWGLGDYVKKRARQIAELGYFAFDADLFGDGKTASNPQEATALTKPYYTNPELTLPAIEAVIAKAASFPQADTTRVAAMGYCFGGFVAVNAAKLGAPLKAAVSFHGRLIGIKPKKGVIKAYILICQGGADQYVPETDQIAFKKSMDSVGADYNFITYPGAMHAYTNPDATALGEKFNMPIAYNAAADTASWNDMQKLFLTALK
jgi:dienelactone hydrolase